MFFLEVILLAIVFAACLSIVWDSVQLGISPMPSSAKARRQMLARIKSKPVGPIIDLGSGWGTLVFAAAKKYKQHQIIGYEKSFFPWLVSVLIQAILRIDNVKLYRQDFLQADLPNEAVLLCYLFPGGMQALAYKLNKEQSKAASLISNTFAMPGWEPSAVIRVEDIYRTPIYIYDIRSQYVT